MPSTSPEDRLLTRIVHAGEASPPILGGAVPPIVRATVQSVPPGTSYADIRYPRLSNLENQVIAAAKLADLEGAEAAVLTASGMAAVTTSLLAVLQAGDELLVQEVLYGGSHSFVHGVLPTLGITVRSFDPRRPDSWTAGPKTRAVYCETIANPLMQVGELDALAAFSRAHGLVSLVDNTFATPLLFRPLAQGFDLSLHSATKYLNGHSDVVAGAVCGSRALVDRVHARLNLLGGSIDPQAAWLLHRGMKTLVLRVRQQVASAGEVARFLADRPEVATVHYPGLPGHPDHDRARRLLDGFGAMLAVELHGGAPAAEAFMGRLRLFMPAISLGGVESLITRPAASSHAGMSARDRAAVGVRDGLLRLSIGIEDPADLIADLAQALG